MVGLFSISLASSHLSSDVRLTTCPFAVFGQLDPSHVSAENMQALEEELQHPTGAPVVSAPLLLMSGLLISKECGLMLEMKHIKGLRCVSRWRVNLLSHPTTGRHRSSEKLQAVSLPVFPNEPFQLDFRCGKRQRYLFYHPVALIQTNGA